LLPFGAPGDIPPCIRQLLFGEFLFEAVYVITDLLKRRRVVCIRPPACKQISSREADHAHQSCSDHWRIFGRVSAALYAERFARSSAHSARCSWSSAILSIASLEGMLLIRLSVPRMITMNADRMSDDTAIRPLGSRMVCTRCGHVGADVRPDWGPHVNKRHVQSIS
jgi:hypothetical protein